MSSKLIYIFTLATLVMTSNCFSRGKVHKGKISFKKIGQIVQAGETRYHVDMTRKKSSLKLSKFCNLDGAKQIDSTGRAYTNCTDQSRPTSPDIDRMEGASITIQ